MILALTVKPHVLAESKLLPPSVIVPPQLPPVVLLATIVFLSVSVPKL